MVEDILLESKIPTFIVAGDNEWNDCGNDRQINAAWGKWTQHFMQFENHWNHSLPVVRSLDYPENFYMIYKRTLIFGLRIVGGRVQDVMEWTTRHTIEVNWVKKIVQMNVPLNADGVLIMAHAKPTEDHVKFFNPLRQFIRDDLNNTVPFFYLHGDGHKYVYTRDFFNQPNFAGLQLQGGVQDPVMKILADPHAMGSSVYSAFQYDRQPQFM